MDKDTRDLTAGATVCPRGVLVPKVEFDATVLATVKNYLTIQLSSLWST